MPKELSKAAQANKARRGKSLAVATAVQWCVENDKGCRAAVSEGAIPPKQKESLKLALRKHKAAIAAAAAHTDAPSPSAKIVTARARADGRMVRSEEERA